MTGNRLLEIARSEGFSAALIPTDQIPVDPKYRAYCEENLCGNYGANYSCPPDCGTVEETHQRLLAEKEAMVIQTVWDIGSYDNKEGIFRAKRAHNAAVLRLMVMDKLRATQAAGFPLGYGGCPLCDPCARKGGEPCKHPEKRISCMSAYCIDVAKLAEKCGLEFAWDPKKLYLFGLIALHGVYVRKKEH